MKTKEKRIEEMADEVARKYVRCTDSLGDSVQNKLDRIIIRQACVEMAKRLNADIQNGGIVMTNKEKAEDMTKTVWYPQNLTENNIQEMLVEMADWKDQQFEEERRDLLGLVNMLTVDEKNQTIIEDLKAILEL